jgi:hypothetical protein
MAMPEPVTKLPPFPIVAPRQIAGAILQNPGSTVLAGRTVSFGLSFAQGSVAPGKTLVASLGGTTETVQIDPKTTYADGSVRMAVVTMVQPSLAPGQSMPVGFALAGASGTQAPINLAALTQPGAYAVNISLTTHNADGTTTAYGFSAAQLLAQAMAGGTLSYWRQGPLATEARLDVPVAGSLHLELDITLNADGSTETDIHFNNDYAMQPTGGTVTYDVAVTRNGSTVLQQNNITQYQYTDWSTQVWSNGAPQVNVQQDISALERTGAIANYDLTPGVANKTIALEARQLGGPTYGTLGSGVITKYMPETGGRLDIGPQPGWVTRWLVTQNATAAQFALAQAGFGGSVPWHLFNPQTGQYTTAADYPTLWDSADVIPGGQQIPLTQAPNVGSNSASGWTPDPAHAPDLAYTAYLLTGDRTHLDELNAEAAYMVLAANPQARGGAEGIVTFGAVRAQAWALRDIIEAATANPDGSPMKAYFTQVLANNIANMQQRAAQLGAQEGAVSGWFPSFFGRGFGLIAPWQEDMLAIEVGQAAALHVPGATEVLAWMTNFIAGLFTNGANGFSPNDAVNYQLRLATNSPVLTPYTTWEEVGAANPTQTTLLGSADYQSMARAALAQSITYTGSTQALQAYGWLLANGTATGTSHFIADPTYDIIPRLRDGHLLTAGQIFIRSDQQAGTFNHTDGDVLIYERGNTAMTLIGGNGIDILFGGAGPTVLQGGNSSDFLFGGSGATTFISGSGNDYMHRPPGHQRCGPQLRHGSDDCRREAGCCRWRHRAESGPRAHHQLAGCRAGQRHHRHLRLRQLPPPARLRFRRARRNARLAQRGRLPFRQRPLVEIRNQLGEQTVPVQFRPEPQEYAAEPDRAAVHQHELARRLHAAGALEARVHALGDRAAVRHVIGFLNLARPVLHQRLVQEARPLVQHRHLLAADVSEAPDGIGVVRLFVVVVAHRLVKVDHAADELRMEDTDDAVVEQVDAAVGPHLVIAEMWIAVQHAIAVERHIPGAEQRLGDAVALLRRGVLLQPAQQRTAVEPRHRQQPARAQCLDRPWDVNARLIAQDDAVETHLRGLARVVQFLAQPLGQFLVDVFLAYNTVHAVIDRHRDLELPQVGFDRAGHVRVLQLARHHRAVRQRRLVHLAKACRGGSRLAEGGKVAVPVWTQFAAHAPAHECGPHRRCVGLKLREFGRVLIRQGVRNGREELRHLHQRALEPAEDCPEVLGMGRAVGLDAEHTLARIARRDAPDRTGGARDPANFTQDRGAVLGASGHQARTFASVASSSSMKPAMTSSPRRQNPGSDASSPNGASSSLCRFVPPARSMSRYFV